METYNTPKDNNVFFTYMFIAVARLKTRNKFKTSRTLSKVGHQVLVREVIKNL